MCQVNIPLWMASASLSGISMLNSSSMAITTSTVSRLSNPRSLEKCAEPEIFELVRELRTDRQGSEIRPLMRPGPMSHVSAASIYDPCLTLTYLVEILQQVHYSTLNFLSRETGRG